MRIKPITAIAVLLLVVVSLSVAACTTQTTTNNTQSTTQSNANAPVSINATHIGEENTVFQQSGYRNYNKTTGQDEVVRVATTRTNLSELLRR
jgi:hypothetical protein